MYCYQKVLNKEFVLFSEFGTLPTAEILSGKNVRAWVSMVLYLKK